MTPEANSTLLHSETARLRWILIMVKFTAIICCKRFLWLVYSSMYRKKKRYCICLGTPKASFSHRLGLTRISVITGLLVPLKARSEEPKYGLLTRVKSRKKSGFYWFFYQYFSAFFWRIVGMSASSFGPKSIKLTCFFHQTLLIFNLSHYGKKHAKLEVRL